MINSMLADDYHLPPMLALNAIPGTHRLLSAEAPTCPAQRVPCLKFYVTSSLEVLVTPVHAT